MSRLSELSTLSVPDQKKVYRTLSASDKYGLWVEKFDILIASTKNGEERNYYVDIKEELNEEMFTSSLGNLEFNQKWKPYLNNLQDNYNWNNDDIYIMFATLFKTEVYNNTTNDNEAYSKVGRLVFHLAELEFSAVSVNCNCRWGGLGCAGDDCSGDSACPYEPSDEMGCGFLLLQSCTGQCD